jgi:hypothetical protein
LELYGITPAQLDALIPNMAGERQSPQEAWWRRNVETIVDPPRSQSIIAGTPRDQNDLYHQYLERQRLGIPSGSLMDGIRFDSMMIDEIPQRPFEDGEQLNIGFVESHLEAYPLQMYGPDHKIESVPQPSEKEFCDQWIERNCTDCRWINEECEIHLKYINHQMTINDCKARKPIPCARCQRYMQGINANNKLELPLVPNELKLKNENSILL